MSSPSGYILFLIATISINYLNFDNFGSKIVGATNINVVNYNYNVNNVDDSVIKSDHLTNDRRIQIQIQRKPSFQLPSGAEVDENSLVDHLQDHEKELIFGKAKKKHKFKLVHLLHATDVEKQTTKHKVPSSQRVRRDAKLTEERQNGAQQIQEVSIQIQDDDDDQLVDIKLQPTPKLIDDAFVFIRRYSNSTQLIEDSTILAKQFEKCFYSNENSALDLCDNGNVRGIFHHNATDYVIHPLPSRFGHSRHIILESDTNNIKLYDPNLFSTNSYITNILPKLDDSKQFEPNDENLNINNARLNQNTANNISTELRYKPHYYEHHYKQQHHHQQQHHIKNHHQQHHHRRRRRHTYSISQVLHIETAIFVDSDLFKHMAKNFPKNTENHLIRFVLAMINGVQLLYHHPSLGHRINFVLKRLEILYMDPKDLRRSSDIDIYLSNFCTWQKNFNPTSDADAMHYDHAVILTGLDLYVVGKNGKEISQVVGLAPVAGMCTPTSSCTINEGKHFESVLVVAHEIGHNLGMRHDTNDNSCDSSLYIMSPTLGSGKITWSKCSRDYLNTFLETNQARCLFDRGQLINNLDHTAGGMLPGERFDADQQCMLKFGKGSIKSRTQNTSDICRDLHCQRDRLTWMSHPALEGTECGDHMWCRSGVCVKRPTVEASYTSPKQLVAPSKPGYDKANFLETSKMGHLLHEYNYNKPPIWGNWGEPSECDSGCLYGPSNRLREGSTGLKIYSRSCLDYRRRCSGRDRKYESCIARQCYSIAITTIAGFANQVCEKAQKFDTELTGKGLQTVGDIEESCKIFCKTKNNGTKSRNWTFPDGTTCRSKIYGQEEISYCIGGRCERFSCDNATSNYHKMDQTFCQYRKPQQQQQQRSESSIEMENRQMSNNIPTITARYAESSKIYNYNKNNIKSNNNNIRNESNNIRNKYENEVAIRNFHGQNRYNQPYKRKLEPYQQNYNKYNYRLNDQRPAPQPPPPPPPPSPPVSASLVTAAAATTVTVGENEWIVKSGCHSSCISKSKGVQVVTSSKTGINNIQLCTHTVRPCDHLSTPAEYAEATCARYKLKVRGLSGYGTQIAASVEEPDRSCRVGCQDEHIRYRFYLVNGKYGHFPLGTRCSNIDERYCINGKCLEFGSDNILLQQSHISLALFRTRRSLNITESEIVRRRSKRSFLYYDPINITETITQDFINNIVDGIMNHEKRHIMTDDFISGDHIEFENPVHISSVDMNVH